jgi:hypothetical protein
MKDYFYIVRALNLDGDLRKNMRKRNKENISQFLKVLRRVIAYYAL